MPIVDNERIGSPIRTVYVWDPLVRVVHWSFVLAFAIAYLTGDDASILHQTSGYVVLALVALRVAWGFIGTKHARFSDFVYPPRTVIDYARGLLRAGARRYIGHNPLGGVMILLMLASLAATSVTGWMLLESTREPAAALSAPATDALAHDRIRHKQEGPLEEVHEILANLTLLLVVLHVGGVLLGSFMHRENLVAAMISGRKRREPE